MSQERKADDPPRPLTARSLVASVLLGTRGGELSVQRLVRTAELFGFAEGTTRVALSRMVAAGELSTDEARYRLAGPLLERRTRQDIGRRPVLRPWDGSWRVGVVTPGARPAGDRADLRRSMRRAGFAEWREGVWLRPDNLVRSGEPSSGACVWMHARFDRRNVTPALAGRLWDLERWRGKARALIDVMQREEPLLRKGDPAALRPSFDTAATVVRHLAGDPLLPDVLLPRPWPGDELRRAYDGFEGAWQALLRQWLRGLPR